LVAANAQGSAICSTTTLHYHRQTAFAAHVKEQEAETEASFDNNNAAMAQIYLVSKEEAKDQVREWCVARFSSLGHFVLCSFVKMHSFRALRMHRTFSKQQGKDIPRKEAHEHYLAWYRHGCCWWLHTSQQ
jgi:hypothetical protein